MKTVLVLVLQGHFGEREKHYEILQFTCIIRTKNFTRRKYHCVQYKITTLRIHDSLAAVLIAGCLVSDKITPLM